MLQQSLPGSFMRCRAIRTARDLSIGIPLTRMIACVSKWLAGRSRGFADPMLWMRLQNWRMS